MNTFSLKPANRALAEGQLEADTQLPGVPFGRKHGVSVGDGEGVVVVVVAGVGSDGASRGGSVGLSIGISSSSSKGSSSEGKPPSTSSQSCGSLSRTGT